MHDTLVDCRIWQCFSCTYNGKREVMHGCILFFDTTTNEEPMTIRRTVSLLLVTILALGFAATSYGTAENEEQAAVSAQATELAPADMPDAQRIIGLHRFVRDEIRQTRTQYG